MVTMSTKHGLTTIIFDDGLTLREGPYFVWAKPNKGLGEGKFPMIAWFDGTRIKNIQILGTAQYFDHSDFSDFVAFEIPSHLYNKHKETEEPTVSVETTMEDTLHPLDHLL